MSHEVDDDSLRLLANPCGKPSLFLDTGRHAARNGFNALMVMKASLDIDHTQVYSCWTFLFFSPPSFLFSLVFFLVFSSA